MKRILLLMMILVLAALGVKAEPVEWSYTVEVEGEDPITYTGKYDILNDKVKIEADQPGGVAIFLKNNSAALENVTPTKLEIGKRNVEMNADDFKALNTTTYSALSRFTTVDLKEATIESITTMSGMNLSGMQYLRLPSSLDNAPAMKDLRNSSKNTALKIAMATKKEVISEGPPLKETNKVLMYSFEKNNVVNGSSALGINLKEMKMVDMAGYYGENDLYNNGNSANFGEGAAAPAAWDFTGANFAACTVGAVQFETPYYNYDDPYQTGATTSGYANYQTNAFYYFSKNSNYTNAVASIKLPDLDMSVLPSHSLIRLGATNKNNYLLLHPDVSANDITGEFAPVEEVVIPNCYTDIDYECGLRSHIQNLVIGSGVKHVHGGAFINSEEMENLDFAKGLSGCYLGDQAFNQCSSMKHIALAEGVVSIGASCFWNSQHLESIRLPESLRFIGNDAFRNCLALGNITIPANVEKIGMRAFKLTALRNVYLTTTDPDKVPVIFTGGTNWGDDNSTFSINEMEGYNTIPWSDTNPYTNGLHTMTWEEAVQWYYVHVNCMTILHYPEQLATKVRAQISSTYGARSSDGYGLPIKDGNGDHQADDPYDDRVKRATGNAPGLDLPPVDLGSASTGTWTNDGWVQFLLMKEFKPDGESKVYTKNYKDVWYTMCFPFELTDEQLASAFNEGFNIADFSGVQIKDPDVLEDNVDKKTLVLHFNRVAETLYKDFEKNLYERVRDGSGNVIREKDGEFEYNIYRRNGVEYHHVIVAIGEAAATKTKTFAPGNNLQEALANKDQAIVIDGYLASAGHPYMIHPNTGTVPEADPVPCHFSGITWVESTDENKTTDQVRAELYEAEKRTVDLGVANTNNNFDQKAYDGYTGQTYTFKGNHKMYRDGYEAIVGPEPTFNQVKPVEPIIPETRPTEPEEVEEPTAPTNPATNPKYTDDFKTLFQTVRCTFSGWSNALQQNVVIDYTYGEDLVNYGQEEFLTQQDWYDNTYGPWYLYNKRSPGHNVGQDNDPINYQALVDYLNVGNPMPSSELSKFTALKTLAEEYTNDLANYESLYANYQTQYSAYRTYLALHAQYEIDLYNYEHSQEVLAAYQSELDAYNQAYSTYLTDYETWEQSVASYKVLIPKYAYFLGTKKGETFPRYFREMAPDDQPRTTGIWSQYAAVIIPNTAALNGLEKELGNTSTTSQAKSHPIAFDEEYFFLDDTPQGIATLIEKIEKEEGKAPEVEYMDIVVSIDGKIVSRDKTTFEGLPKGVYIINGKKYYVK